MSKRREMDVLLFFTLLSASIPLATLREDIGSNQYVLRRALSCQHGPNYTTLTYHDIFFDYTNSNFEAKYLADNYNYYHAYIARSLAIVNSSLPTILPSFFSHHSAMQECWLVNLNISKIISGAFAMLTDLRCLNMSGNKIDYIQEGIFSGLQSLSSLDLSQNKINNISEHAFIGLNSLQSLYLQENKIIFLHDNLFMSQVKSMKFINISSNKLKEIHDTFRYMNLKTVYLSNNEIDILYLNNANVASIYLEGNRITNVTKVDKSIEILDLSKNLVGTIDDHAFTNSSLKEIYLSYNNISELHKELFFGLFNLTGIHLDHNNISSLPNTCFKDLSNLEYLDLSHNGISKLQYGIFDNFKNLKYINISYNNLNYLNEDVFSHLKDLEEISISNNYIQNIDTFRLVRYCPLLNKLELDGNIWKCNSLTKIITDLEKYKKSMEVVKGTSFESENVRGISCRDSYETTTIIYHSNSSFNVTTASSAIKEINIANSALSKFFNDDFRNTSMYNYFNGGFQNSSFFKYIESLNPHFVMEKIENLNESHSQGLFRNVGVEKTNVGYSSTNIILIVIAIALITILVLMSYSVWNNKRNSSYENVEMM